MLSRFGRLCVAVFIALLLLPSVANAQTDSDDFITTWRMPADDLSLTFPGSGSYTIDWGDDTAPQTSTGGNIEHTYANADDYTISVSNTITRFKINSPTLESFLARSKLIDIKQWGTARWTNMASAFHGASNMDMSATLPPDLSAVGDMNNMFRDASSFNGDLSGWTVSNVMDMSRMFQDASAFNGGDLSNWDVSNVTSMDFMFINASAFNGNISNWDVSTITNMTGMFTGASVFSQNLGNWYIVPGEINLNYDGSIDLRLHTITAQNSVLNGHGRDYALIAGAGDNDNDKFTLTADGQLNIKPADTTAGTYTVRIAANSMTFGTDNARAITVEVPSLSATDSSLTTLSLSNATLSPAFNSAAISYTANSTANSLTVTATTAAISATLDFSGTAADGNTLTVTGTTISGLTAGTNTLVITVTAADGTIMTAYTVTVTVAIPDTAPSFGSATTVEQTYTVGTAIADLILPAATSGNGDLTYRMETLPDGLSFDAVSRSIGGTPISASARQAYRYAVIDSDNNDESTDADSLDVFITVNAAPPPVIIASAATLTAEVDTPITPITISNSGGAVDSYTIEPNLTADTGLDFDTATGEISGRPTAVTAEATYTISAINATDTAMSTVVITVNDMPPFLFIRTNTGTLEITLGTPIIPVIIGNNRGTVVSYAIEPDLNANTGLNFNTAANGDGEISGTPTVAVTTEVVYTITATNSGGMHSITVTIAPPFLRGGNTPLVFTPGGQPVPVQPNLILTLTTTDSVTQARVEITEGLESDDILAVGGNISNDLASGFRNGRFTIVPKFPGTPISNEDWQSALRSVTYSTGSDNPSTAPRTINFTAIVNNAAGVGGFRGNLNRTITFNVPDTTPAFAADAAVPDQTYAAGD